MLHAKSLYTINFILKCNNNKTYLFELICFFSMCVLFLSVFTNQFDFLKCFFVDVDSVLLLITKVLGIEDTMLWFVHILKSKDV